MQGGEVCQGWHRRQGGRGPASMLSQFSVLPIRGQLETCADPEGSWQAQGCLLHCLGLSACPSVNHVTLFALDTLYTAVQSTGEIKASEMVYDTT